MSNIVDQNKIRKLRTDPQKALTEFRVSRLIEEVRGLVIKEVKNAFSPTFYNKQFKLVKVAVVGSTLSSLLF